MQEPRTDPAIAPLIEALGRAGLELREDAGEPVAAATRSSAIPSPTRTS